VHWNSLLNCTFNFEKRNLSESPLFSALFKKISFDFLKKNVLDKTRIEKFRFLLTINGPVIKTKIPNVWGCSLWLATSTIKVCDHQDKEKNPPKSSSYPSTCHLLEWMTTFSLDRISNFAMIFIKYVGDCMINCFW
jgi:hypothetical protein